MNLGYCLMNTIHFKVAEKGGRLKDLFIGRKYIIYDQGFRMCHLAPFYSLKEC